MTAKGTLYIGGEWVTPQGMGTIEVISPVTEEVIATVPDGSMADIDLAVAAARKAFDGGLWPRLSPKERADIMAALSARLLARSEEIARTITEENGSPISFSRSGQLGSVMLLDYYTNLVREF